MPGRDVHVHMCEVAVGSAGEVLRATLGSCVGIAMLWRARGICGLAHCLLPGEGHARVDRDMTGVGARYVTQAVPSLIRMMNIPGVAMREIEVVIAGGANMVNYERSPAHAAIGDQNVRVALSLIAELGLKVVYTDTGGVSGRQLVIDCAEHSYAVRTFTRSF